MKNFLLLSFFSLLVVTELFAQNIELMKKDGSAIENDSITVSTSNDSSTIEVPVYVKNNSSKSMDVLVKVYKKQMVSGSSASFCWGASCFDINTNEPEAFTTIAASDTAKEFHSDYEPNKNAGATEFMYTFYNKADPDDSVSVSIYYEIVVTGLNDYLDKIKESIKGYPNPVQDILYINYEIQNKQKSNIAVYNIVGKKVKSKEVSTIEKSTSIDVSDLKKGVYIWTFELNGTPVKSEKIIKR